jgi:hypothetical protein
MYMPIHFVWTMKTVSPFNIMPEVPPFVISHQLLLGRESKLIHSPVCGWGACVPATGKDNKLAKQKISTKRWWTL